MPKVLKDDYTPIRTTKTKKCKCGVHAASNVSGKCLVCRSIFQIKKNPKDRRGKGAKKCSICSRTAKSNRSKQCWHCHRPYITPANPWREQTETDNDLLTTITDEDFALLFPCHIQIVQI